MNRSPVALRRPWRRPRRQDHQPTPFDGALETANESDDDLAASVLTPSQEHAQVAVRELRAGTVKVNAVWGGAPGGSAQPQGRSGLGFGYGPELLDEVTFTKVVHVEPAPEP